jgi:prolyl-tRNA editing enzyme YbaK/EbsC (Cys-tRNA(Pro) deacylase)
MTEKLHACAQKVQDVLDALGIASQVVQLPASTRSAAEAAQAIGCRLEQIAKSLIFRGQRTDKPILVIASGANRIDEAKLAVLIGEPIVRADADFVRTRTGYVIGGVAPVGHLEPMAIFIDADLLQLQEIWAAAGTPHAVCRLAPTDLQKIPVGQVVRVK